MNTLVNCITFLSFAACYSAFRDIKTLTSCKAQLDDGSVLDLCKISFCHHKKLTVLRKLKKN